MKMCPSCQEKYSKNPSFQSAWAIRCGHFISTREERKAWLIKNRALWPLKFATKELFKKMQDDKMYSMNTNFHDASISIEKVMREILG